MTKNEQAILIALGFLALYGYGLWTFEGVSVNLGFASFTLKDYSQPFAFFGFAAAFMVFLVMRRQGKKTEGAEPEES